MTLKETQRAKIGTVVVSPLGVVAQKHGPDCWYLAQGWEGSVRDADVVGDTFLTVTKWKVRDFD